MKTKRLIALILSAVLMFGTLPLTALAADTLISVMDITLSEEDFPAPVGGESIYRDITSIVSQYEQYHCVVDRVDWAYRGDDNSFYWTSVSDTEAVFEYNKLYYLRICLKPADGYAFQVSSSGSQKWWYTLNDKDSYIANVTSSNLQLFWEYPKTDPDTVAGFNLTLSENDFPLPVAGESMARDAALLSALCEGYDFDIVYSGWVALPDGAVAIDDGRYYPLDEEACTFQGGLNYYLLLEFYVEGKLFDPENSDIYKLNGKSPIQTYYSAVTSSSRVYSYIDLAYYYGRTSGEPSEPITEIEITGLKVPVVGETADFNYSIPEGAGYYINLDPYSEHAEDIPGCGWWFESEKEPASLSDVFDGISYKSDGEPLVFKEGYAYTFLTVLSEASANFSKDITVTVNGSAASFDDSEINNIWVWYTFNLGAPEAPTVENIEITDAQVPTPGDALDFTGTIPADAPYTADRPYWYVSEYLPSSFDECTYFGQEYTYGGGRVFEEGKSYTYAIDIDISAVKFDRKTLTATVNGNEANIAFDEYYETATVWYTYDLGASTLNGIDGLDIMLDMNELGRPVAGESGYRENYEELEYGTDSFEEVEELYLGWWVVDEGNFISNGSPIGIADPSSVLPEDGRIYLVVMLFSANGYVFNYDNAVNYTLNGISPVYSDVGMTDAMLIYDLADLPDRKLIEGFDLTLSEAEFPLPVEGESVQRDTDVLTSLGEGQYFTVEPEHLYWVTDPNGAMQRTSVTDTSEVFDEETTYYIGLRLTAADGYMFDSEITTAYTLNGQAPSTVYLGTDTDGVYYMDIMWEYGTTGVLRGTGDINGDSEINAEDYALLKRSVIGTYTLNDDECLFGDIDGSGVINALDYVLLKRSVLGTYIIE